MTNIKKVLIALLTIVLIPTVIPSTSAKAFNASESASVVSENLNSSELNIVKVSVVNVDVKISDKVINSKKTLPKQPVVMAPVSNPVSGNYPSYSREEIEAKICAAFGSECSNALIIVKHESNFRQYAVSRTNDYGLFQLNCRWQARRVGGDCTRFFDIDTNIRVARQIFAEQGWRPWTTKIFLPK